MGADVWDRTIGLLQRRFITNAYLPVFLLPLSIVLTVTLGLDRLDALLVLTETLGVATLIIAIIGYALAVWFLAAFLQSQWRNLVRLFEGYAFEGFPRVSNWGVKHHRAQLERVQTSTGRSHVQYYRYPIDPGDVMPTSLGNVLRAAERYPHDRYRADSIYIWPRLAALVPGEFAAQIDEFRGNMEFLTVVSAWCAVYTAGSAIGLLAFGGDAILFAVVMSLGSLFAWGAYRGSVQAAVEYGEQLRVGHDLYRFRVFDALHLPCPQTLVEEQTQWERLEEFIVSNFEEGVIYTDGVSEG